VKRDNTMTQRYLADAGVTHGMRVMEIGCGGGEVTQVLAELVGSSGTVVAIDRNKDALAMARERMKEQGIEHVQLMSVDVAGDLSSLESLQHESFDVLGGRRVLMYLRDPAEVLRRLARWLKSGGVVVFEETDSTMVPARTTPMAAHDQAMEWLRRMLVAEGANTAMGFGLPATLVQAGLRFERIRAEAVIQGQGTQYPLSALLKLVQSRIISSGIASQAEVDSLAARVDAESRDPACVYVSEMSFCAWARKL
jgi:2-polyprenyl-3-methyl-5-hydroxy-6-metoxy-1,4-benzoquinol methylase